MFGNQDNNTESGCTCWSCDALLYVLETLKILLLKKFLLAVFLWNNNDIHWLATLIIHMYLL